MRIILSLTLFLIIGATGNSQQEHISYQDLNDSIEYSVLLVSGKLMDDSIYFPRKHFVSVPDSLVELVEGLPKERLLELLRSDKHGWAVNLALYDLYDRDGELYTFLTPEKWYNEYQKGELEFWRGKIDGEDW